MDYKYVEFKDISYETFGNIIFMQEYINGKILEKRHYKWLNSNKKTTKFDECFYPDEIEKYLQRLDGSGITSVVLNNKILNVTNHGHVLVRKTLYTNIVNQQRLFNLIKSNHKYKNIATLLETLMKNKENNKQWVSNMKKNIKVSGDMNLDLFQYLENNSDPQVLEWAQFCAILVLFEDKYILG
jgi:hypothetical protein